jgi:hypothetical protein
MSHFLERLAAGVTQPASQARLRPLLGSIFAQGAQTGQAESARVETSVLSPLRQTAVQTEEGRSPRSALRAEGTPRTEEHQVLPLLRAGAQPESLPPAGSHIGAEKTATRPPISVSNPAAPFEVPFAARGAAANLSHNEQLQQSGPALASHQQLEETEVSGVYRPLIHVEEPSSTRPAPHRLPFPTEAGTAKSSNGETASRSTPLREPDEIHIHIGRIEVAAIAQPAPRPTAQPVRKSLNLSEYLKRGNGRAG